MTLARLLRISLLAVLLTLLFTAYATMGQTETGTISGLITDETGAAVPGAGVQLLNVQRGTTTDAKTNGAGIYVFASVQPGPYQLKVHKPGFKQVDLLSLIVNVQDHIEQNVRLQIGSVSESVTVNADDVHINTTDATVSTVVDRQFAENLPLNGRSFQSLIELTPGVALTASNPEDNGQFSVNGQRAAANYWTVDGVSANTGIAAADPYRPGNGASGAAASLGVLGGTNGVVSVDAMQEFRIQTSTFAPEFGRTPGAQISIVTRSGTDQFHGTIFDYFRNGVLDANNWFADANKLAKPQEKQNDFGGTFFGPIVKEKTFFFFSYEGLRLRLPETTLTTVPDLAARETAVPALQSYLAAFPVPNGPDNTVTGVAQFNATYANPASLDAYSLRIDHKVNQKWNLFGRYSYSPSSLAVRGGGAALSSVESGNVTSQTGTVGATWLISPAIANDLRFNYTRTEASTRFYEDTFGGATPLESLPFPELFNAGNGNLDFIILSLQQGALEVGRNADNVQRQINVVDSLSVQRGLHSLKFGVDFRRLTPQLSPYEYGQIPLFFTVPSAVAGNAFLTDVLTNVKPQFLFRNLGMYAQDSWRLAPRLTLTYGVRWDTDFAPHSLNGPNYAAVTSLDLVDISTIALVPGAASPYRTTYGNFAPRIGAAYQVRGNRGMQTVLRGGFGVFYDLASSQVGDTRADYPFGGSTLVPGAFPISPVPPPPPVTATGFLNTFDPNLKLPYTLEWNVAVEQGLGEKQTVSVSYVGASGRRLLQTSVTSQPVAGFSDGMISVSNAATSDYNALQAQFQRRLSSGLQMLLSYTWSHSIDDGSAGSAFLLSNLLLPGGSNENRGPSDFDIRHTFTAGMTYDVPVFTRNAAAKVLLGGWSIESLVFARSAAPVDVEDAQLTSVGPNTIAVRPDLVPGQPLYLFGSQYPSGKAFNPDAFTNPPTDPVTGLPLRQGDVPRNFMRGFGAAQWDFAVHRDFPIHESLHLQFRAEMFNVLNHPNFGPPSGNFGMGGFGVSTQMLGESLNNQNLGGGALSPLYQIGGPRSIQLALKLFF